MAKSGQVKTLLQNNYIIGYNLYQIVFFFEKRNSLAVTCIMVINSIIIRMTST